MLGGDASVDRRRRARAAPSPRVCAESVTRSSVSTMTLLSGMSSREELRRHAGDDAALVLERALARHRRRRADALELLGREPLAHAAHEQRDVGALPAAVGVKLVEHEEPQARAVADDAGDRSRPAGSSAARAS